MEFEIYNIYETILFSPCDYGFYDIVDYIISLNKVDISAMDVIY